MSDFTVFYSDFEQYLNTNWVTTPIVKSVNVPNEPPTPFDPYITYKTDFNKIETISISGLGGGGVHATARDIIMSIIVFAPSASGESVAIDLAQQLETLFTNIQLPISKAFSRDAEIVYAEQSEGLWWKVEVAVYFEQRNCVN